MRVSVLIPTYQESKYIGRCLESLVANDIDFAGTGSEILVIDGHSTDGTRDIVTDLAQRHPFIRLIDNPDTVQVVGLNVGLKIATGDLIVRCDAHSEYPHNYIPELLKWHEKGIAANIGGCWITLSGDDSLRAHAIAAVMRHPLGVGLTYRTVQKGCERFVDTVPFGSWRRETLDKFGHFDEEFTRAQDLEHNVRLRQQGQKILMLPWLRIRYFARETFDKAASMFYQYGYWKNKVNRKYGTLCSLRQLIPPLFVLGFAALFIASFFSSAARWCFAAYTTIYLSAVLVSSVFIHLRQKGPYRSPVFFPLVVFAFFITHFSYGIGYLRGFVEIMLFNRKHLDEHLKDNTR
ncbi:MAG TPA: glycosyltransferase family 2 protein [bacterium]|nr:glycosyltransferase family 2 protein [bacterium]